jgi:hypothetical protein
VSEWLKSKLPVVGNNGNWFVYDFNADGYVDTGLASKGPKGDTGAPGDPGIKGNSGDKGDKGDGLAVKGCYDTLLELTNAHPTGEEGDVYLVGDRLYFWDVSLGTWKMAGGFTFGPVVDNLTSKSILYSLSANMGRVLDRIKPNEPPVEVENWTRLDNIAYFDGYWNPNYRNIVTTPAGEIYLQNGSYITPGLIRRWNPTARTFDTLYIGGLESVASMGLNESSGTVYVGMFGNGIKILDENSYLLENTNISTGSFYRFFNGDDGRFYALGNPGIYRLDEGSGDFIAVDNSGTGYFLNAIHFNNGIYFAGSTASKYLSFADNQLYDVPSINTQVKKFVIGADGALYALGSGILRAEAGNYDNFTGIGYPAIIGGLYYDGVAHFDGTTWIAGNGIVAIRKDMTVEKLASQPNIGAVSANGVLFFGDGSVLDPSTLQLKKLARPASLADTFDFIDVFKLGDDLVFVVPSSSNEGNAAGGLYLLDMKRYARAPGKWVAV